MVRGRKLPLAVIGCDFRVAGSRWRSRLVLEQRDEQELARELLAGGTADGLVVLNTCNRNEWIVSSANPKWATELLRSRMQELLGPEARRRIEPYALVSEEAARHIFRVAIGQESLVLGERQISGQLFKALETARARGTSSRVLNGLGSIAGRLLRSASRAGGVVSGEGSGVHALAVGLLRDRLRVKKRARVAVIGLGFMGRKIRALLESDPLLEVSLCNRTVREKDEGVIHPLTKLPEILAEADGAIVCTGALQAVVTPEHLRLRKGRSALLLIDIGVPEQVERAGLPAWTQVVGSDELVAYWRDNAVALGEQPAAAGDQADTLVQRAVAELALFCSQPTFTQVLEQVRQHHQHMVYEQIPELIAARLDYLPEETRARLKLDLRNMVVEFTNEVFRTLKEASQRGAGIP